MTLRKYIFIDLSIFTLFGLIISTINVIALKNFSTLFFIVDLSLLVVFISMFRWNKLGGLIGIPITLYTVLISGGTTEHFLIYGLGSIFLIANVYLFRYVKKESFYDNFVQLSLFVLLGYVLVFIGRMIMVVMLRLDFVDAISTYLFDELINIVIVSIVLFLLSKQQTIVVDMITYLTLLKQSEEEEHGDI